MGKVTKGMDEVVLQWYQGYGDMPPWGKGPEQQPIYDGPKYIEDNFPLLDKFLTCKVETKLAQGSNLPPPGSADNSNEDSWISGSDDDDDEEEEEL